MFDVGLFPLLLEGAGMIERPQVVIDHPIELVQLSSKDPQRSELLQTYLGKLQGAGFSPERQGVWMQTGDRLLEANRGDQLISAASLTKAATTLAVLHRHEPNHRFVTRVSRTGEIENGVLKGDLIIEGGMDLLMMRPQAIAFGTQLESLGIRQVAGDLVVLFPYRESLPEPDQVGTILREGMNVGLWSEDTLRHYKQHMPTAQKPNVTIAGEIKPFQESLGIAQELLIHQSPPVIEMLKYMNLHSSNDLAETFAAEMGGSQATLETVLSTSGLPPQEVQLQNGSGLGEANKMTPRAVVGIFIAIQRRLMALNLDLKDAFPVSGQDIGTLEDRTMPKGAVVKTGTLWNVSALAGYIPTEKEGRVWFAIMNEGDDYVDGFRKSQDVVLNQMVQNLALSGGASAPVQ